jgi:hypothetical protein
MNSTKGRVIWRVRMCGKLGYSCIVELSNTNAKTEVEAGNLAARMFPELRVVEDE